MCLAAIFEIVAAMPFSNKLRVLPTNALVILSSVSLLSVLVEALPRRDLGITYSTSIGPWSQCTSVSLSFSLTSNIVLLHWLVYSALTQNFLAHRCLASPSNDFQARTRSS